MANEIEKYDINKNGLSRHGHQYGESLLFRRWITSTLKPLVDLQDVLFSLLDIDIDKANGVKLDLIGRIVGAPAFVFDSIPIAGYFGFEQQELAEYFGEIDDPSIGGVWLELGDSGYTDMALSETEYRTVIKAQIVKNTSLCTPPDIIKITRMILGDDIDFVYIERPMAIIIAPKTYLSRYHTELLLMMIPRPMGVGVSIVNGYHDDFGFKDQHLALPMGETGDKEVGGYWSTTRETMQYLTG